MKWLTRKSNNDQRDCFEGFERLRNTNDSMQLKKGSSAATKVALLWMTTSATKNQKELDVHNATPQSEEW